MGEVESDAAAVDAGHGAASERLAPPLVRAGAIGLLEVIDRDGHVRQAWRDPDLAGARRPRARQRVVLTDPHVAAHHFRIEAVDGGLAVRVGDSVNGVTLGGQSRRTRRRRAAAARRRCDRHRSPAAPSCACAWPKPRWRRRCRCRRSPCAICGSAPTLVLAVVLVAGLAFNTCLDTDPDNLVRALGYALLTTACRRRRSGARLWALLSKTFTRQSASRLAPAGLRHRQRSRCWRCRCCPACSAFALSWPWLTDFSFVGTLRGRRGDALLPPARRRAGPAAPDRAGRRHRRRRRRRADALVQRAAHRPARRRALHEPPVPAGAAHRAAAGDRLVSSRGWPRCTRCSTRRPRSRPAPTAARERSDDDE